MRLNRLWWLPSGLVVCFLSVSSVSAKQDPTENHSDEQAVRADISYSFGYDLGQMLYGLNGQIDFEALEKGVRDGIANNKAEFNVKERKGLKRDAFRMIRENRDRMVLEESHRFLEENSQKDGIAVLESGLQYEILTSGDGGKPKLSDRVKINFDARSLKGSYIGNTFTTEMPEAVVIEDSIAGLKEGLLMMNVGSKYRFFIPPDLWDRKVLSTANLSPHDVLIYEVELLDILFNFSQVK